jgi:hypothetical protein
VDPNKPTLKWSLGLDRCVDAVGQAYKIRIEGAYNDASMIGMGFVQADEVFPIQRQQRTPFLLRKGQNCLIGHRLPRLSRFHHG